MNRRSRNDFLQLLLALLPLFAFGCTALQVHAESAANIHVGEVAKPSTGQPIIGDIVLRVASYVDSRPRAPSRKIGDIRATVIDMHATELVADQEIADIVTGAIANQLKQAGFRVLAPADKPAAGGTENFQVSGSIRDFALTIAGRDEVSIVVETTLRDSRGGTVVWSGVVSEKTDRYAGVTGNTKGSIVRYLSGALGVVTDKTVAQVADAIRQVRPELFRQTAATTKPMPGVEVTVAPRANAPPPEKEPSGAPHATGRLVVGTNPARAKVYLGDVYYGLSPLRLELEPDIYVLRVKLDGFKTATEKVSVRKGDTTELDIMLEK